MICAVMKEVPFFRRQLPVPLALFPIQSGRNMAVGSFMRPRETWLRRKTPRHGPRGPQADLIGCVNGCSSSVAPIPHHPPS